jgi:hypothetical protein
MAKPGKSKPAHTTKKWLVVTDADKTEIDADTVQVNDGVLILFRNGASIVAAWNSWRYITRMVEPTPEEPPS